MKIRVRREIDEKQNNVYSFTHFISIILAAASIFLVSVDPKLRNEMKHLR